LNDAKPLVDQYPEQSMIDFSEIGDDETWELFARDFFTELGFVIDTEPGRGADQGKDLIVSEQLGGRLASEKFTWLVSCKYFTVSGRAVGQDKEENIRDRLDQHSADGFIGFYSTVASSSLIERLRDLKSNYHIRQFDIFDRKKIEAYFYKIGMSKLILRYFKGSYKLLKPIQIISNEYEPLMCEVCKKDVLKTVFQDPHSAIIVWSIPKDSLNHCEDVFICCKGACDTELERKLEGQGFVTGWDEFSDLSNPILYLSKVFAYINNLYENEKTFSKGAHEKQKDIFLSLAQVCLREMSHEDREQYKTLAHYGLV
jgi:hypothetical protein